MASPREPVLPMRAVSGPVPTDPGWAFEVKWDGMRIIAEVDGDVRLSSGNAIDVTVRFPELAALADHLGAHRAVLDGEVVAFDATGRTDFGRLQPRMHASDPAQVARLRSQVPVTYVVFDLLELDGTSTADLPYEDRRRLLTSLVEPADSWIVPAHQVGDGQDLYDAAATLGLEGIMAKRIDSPYRPGRRSATWRKCKVRRGQEVVVGGWSTGTGNRSSTLGALLVGVHDPDAPGSPLRFAGGVGTGFDDATLRDLMARLAELASGDCPFEPRPPSAVTRTAHWVDPRLVVQVEFGEWTGDGRLRHPAYVGLRLDKDPADVVREPDGLPS
ncbi:ATP-dependent DNA ligase [soil metagenome]